MEHVQTGTRLYGDSPWTFTMCQERVSSYPNFPLVIGGFSSSGLRVDYYYSYGYEYYGLWALRKFF